MKKSSFKFNTYRLEEVTFSIEADLTTECRKAIWKDLYDCEEIPVSESIYSSGRLSISIRVPHGYFEAFGIQQSPWIPVLLIRPILVRIEKCITQTIDRHNKA